MNAVSLNPASSPLPKVVPGVIPGWGPAASANAAPGFADLVSLFLSSLSGLATDTDAQEEVDQKADDSQAPQMVAPDQIAAAMIQSMLTPAAVSKKPAVVPASEKKPAGLSAVVLNGMPTMLAMGLTPQLVKQAEPMMPMIAPPGTTLDITQVAPQSKAPLAFEMQVTPVAINSATPAPVPPAEPVNDQKPVFKALVLQPDAQQPFEKSEKVVAAAATQHSGDNSGQHEFQNAFQQAPVQQSTKESRVETAEPMPSISSADGKDIDVNSALPKSLTAQQISVRISRPETPNVDLHVIQRAGQIQVAVRTPDPTLETALRQDIGSLVHSLERSGFHAETFVPVTRAGEANSSQMNSADERQNGNSDFSGSGSHHQGGRGHGGNSRGNQQQQPQGEIWSQAWEEEV